MVMHRIYLAFLCFFRVLLGKALPAELVPGLEQPQLPAAAPSASASAAPAATARSSMAAAAPVPVPVPAPVPAGAPAALAGEQRASTSLSSSSSSRRSDLAAGALQLLAMLQREGRLIDFLREPIDAYDDAAIGAAVRDIHRGCAKVLGEHFVVEPVVPGEENSRFIVEKDFDPMHIRLVGGVNGKPPFHGLLRHHGWRAARVQLPVVGDGVDLSVVAPAEVEVE
ncbi:MAG: DUF2760 domain-containing protein [Pseudomonadota bacterium]